MNSSHILICKLVFLINIIIQNYSVNCIPIADDGEFYDKNRKINKPDDHYVCDVDPNRKMCSVQTMVFRRHASLSDIRSHAVMTPTGPAVASSAL